MKLLQLLLFALLFFSCQSQQKKHENEQAQTITYDSHVHIMSPQLIQYWKSLGIPFSKSEVNYSNIDTILKNCGAEYINLIGMAYVYGNPEYYQSDEVQDKMMRENDHVLEAAKKYPQRVKAFFAVDPLKEFAINEMERCYGLNPNTGLKLHFNTSQVYLTEPEHRNKVKKVLAKSAEYQIPVLLHFDNWHPKFGQRDMEILVDTILPEIPPVEIQIAHFGSSGGFNQKTKDIIDTYLALKNQNRIPAKHRIYFDISAVALDEDSEGVSKLINAEFKELNRYIDLLGIENIVFGTDYPLYNGKQYLKILRDRVHLSDVELNEMMKRRPPLYQEENDLEQKSL